jgi:hypothetical protein
VLLGISHLEEDVLAFNIAQLAQPVPEFFKASLSGLIDLTGVAEDADTRHCSWRLCLDGKWRDKDTKGERDDAPESDAPHGHFLTSASCRPFSLFFDAERCASAAAGSGSAADAVRRRLQAIVRPGLNYRASEG